MLLDEERRRDVLERQLLQEWKLQGRTLLQLGGAIIKLQRLWFKRRVLPDLQLLHAAVRRQLHQQSQRRRAVLLVEPVQKQQLQGRPVLDLQLFHAAVRRPVCDRR